MVELPDDVHIPDEVWEAAENVWHGTLADARKKRGARIVIARAIIAERERCANAVETLARIGFALNDGEKTFAQLAANVIRQGDDPAPSSPPSPAASESSVPEPAQHKT